VNALPEPLRESWVQIPGHYNSSNRGVLGLLSTPPTARLLSSIKHRVLGPLTHTNLLCLPHTSLTNTIMGKSTDEPSVVSLNSYTGQSFIHLRFIHINDPNGRRTGYYANRTTHRCLKVGLDDNGLFLDDYDNLHKKYRLRWNSRATRSDAAMAFLNPHMTEAQPVGAAELDLRHISIFLKDNLGSTLVCKDRDTKHIRFERVPGHCYFLALPEEIRRSIIYYAIDSNTDEVHISEARAHMRDGKVRITFNGTMPRGSVNDATRGDPITLRHSFNSFHHVHCTLKWARGLEILTNTIKANIHNFDSLIRYEPKRDHMQHIRRVYLLDESQIGLYPKEHLLHPLIRFALKHPLAHIDVGLESMVLVTALNLSNFLRLTYCVRAAMRGEARPGWLDIHDRDEVTVWLRGKQPNDLNAPNVNFWPHGHKWDEAKDPDRVWKFLLPPKKGKAAKYKETILQGIGGDKAAFVNFVRDVFVNGICA
jgi:hypothetical protein